MEAREEDETEWECGSGSSERNVTETNTDCSQWWNLTVIDVGFVGFIKHFRLNHRPAEKRTKFIQAVACSLRYCMRCNFRFF